MFGEAEYELFGIVRQPRAERLEAIEVYAAVVTLRMRGHRVWRRGRKGHIVDGRFVPSGKMLVRMAEQEARRR